MLRLSFNLWKYLGETIRAADDSSAGHVDGAAT